MAKKSTPATQPAERRPEPCTYASVKIDDELPPIIRQAAAKALVSVQEFMSDALNKAAAETLGQDPITRRTAPRGK